MVEQIFLKRSPTRNALPLADASVLRSPVGSGGVGPLLRAASGEDAEAAARELQVELVSAEGIARRMSTNRDYLQNRSHRHLNSTFHS